MVALGWRCGSSILNWTPIGFNRSHSYIIQFNFLSNTLRGRDLGKHFQVYENFDRQLLGLSLIHI